MNNLGSHSPQVRPVEFWSCRRGQEPSKTCIYTARNGQPKPADVMGTGEEAKQGGDRILLASVTGAMVLRVESSQAERLKDSEWAGIRDRGREDRWVGVAAT